MNNDAISRKAALSLTDKYIDMAGVDNQTHHAMCCVAEEIKELPDIKADGNTSDGYHTFNELYDHRAKLFSVIVRNYPSLCWKSKLHSDGTMFDGMFIVGINTPQGQASYHYDIDPYWDMFICRELERAPVWDGHTPEDAINRIAALDAATVARAKRNKAEEYVYANLTCRTALEGLAEECCELAQAALKFIRAKDGENPTPISEEKCAEKFYEEAGDVLMLLELLGILEDGTTAHNPKWERWAKRIRESKCRTNCGAIMDAKEG